MCPDTNRDHARTRTLSLQTAEFLTGDLTAKLEFYDPVRVYNLCVATQQYKLVVLENAPPEWEGEQAVQVRIFFLFSLCCCGCLSVTGPFT